MTQSMADSLGESYISTPMPLAGHDEEGEDLDELTEISTPMPLAGHDLCSSFP